MDKTKTYTATLSLFVFLGLFPSFLRGQGPCVSNPQAQTTLCPGDTLTLTPLPFNCTTCVFNWSGSPQLSNNGQTASYVFPAPANYPNVAPMGQVTMSYSDPGGSCTGTGFWTWEIARIGLEQMSPPALLNGPYTGDTSLTWIYTREHIALATGTASWDYFRNYSIAGGALVSSSIGVTPDAFGNYYDTLAVNWQDNAFRQISSSGTLSMNLFWYVGLPFCSAYEEELPAETIPNAAIWGPDTVFQPDTSTYSTAYFSNAAYTWTVVGGTIISGQGSNLVEVSWTNLPGSISVNRLFNSTNSSATLNVYSPNPPIVNLGPDTVLCNGASLVLDAGPGTGYLWSTGASSQSITVVDSGFYAVTVSHAAPPFSYADTIRVDTASSSPFSLGNDSTVCPGQAVVLAGPGGYASYAWSTGGIGQNTTALSTGSYSLVTTNAAGCYDSDTLEVFHFLVLAPALGNDTALCAGDSLLLDAGGGYSGYAWSNAGSGQSQYVDVPGGYSVTVTDANGCTAADTVEVTLGDCVFPGDCDDNGLADNNDVLAVGVAFGQAGPPRPNASLLWTGQPAPDFSGSLPTGPNAKHCDSNGDGLVNADDTLAIALNYGLTHNKAFGSQSGGPVLLLSADFDSVQAGDTARYRISLGDSLNLADSVYGIAFTVNYDTSLVDSNGLLYADFSVCWTAPQADLLTFTMDLYPMPRADLAVVRTTASDTSGFGEVCRLGFVTIDNISGKRKLLAQALKVSLSDIRFVNREMMPLAISGSEDSTVVFQEELGLGGGGGMPRLSLYPVPAGDEFLVEMAGDRIASWTLLDQGGRILRAGDGALADRVRVESSGLADGVYFLEVVDSAGRLHHGKVALLH